MVEYKQRQKISYRLLRPTQSKTLRIAFGNGGALRTIFIPRSFMYLRRNIAPAATVIIIIIAFINKLKETFINSQGKITCPHSEI
jgi:hypothetical protein